MSDWGLSEILSMPDAPAAHVTKVFVAGGREWPITIDTSKASDAETFFEFASLLGKKDDGSWAQKVEPIEIVTPHGKRIRVDSRQYIVALRLLESAAVSPKLSAEEWAIFGDKVRGQVMGEISGWLFEVSGVGKMGDEVKAAKNDSAPAESVSQTSSLERVSSFLQTLPDED